MLACKGIFAKPSILQPRIARGGAAAKAYEVRLKFNFTLEFGARARSGLRWKTEHRSVFGNMVSERTSSVRCYTMFFKLADTVSKRASTD